MILNDILILDKCVLRRQVMCKNYVNLNNDLFWKVCCYLRLPNLIELLVKGISIASEIAGLLRINCNLFYKNMF